MYFWEGVLECHICIIVANPVLALAKNVIKLALEALHTCFLLSLAVWSLTVTPYWHIFIMIAVVNTPLAVWACEQCSLRSGTSDVIQPDSTSTRGTCTQHLAVGIIQHPANYTIGHIQTDLVFFRRHFHLIIDDIGIVLLKTFLVDTCIYM